MSVSVGGADGTPAYRRGRVPELTGRLTSRPCCQVPVDACRFDFGCCLTRPRRWIAGLRIGPAVVRWMVRACSPACQTWITVSVTQQSTIACAYCRPMYAARRSNPMTPVPATSRWIHCPSTTGIGGGVTDSAVGASCRSALATL
jgi:hypothetical protein